MNKIIFLDIDGVLNSNFWNEEHQKEISDGSLIDEEKVKLLSILVNKTNGKIVLHSGWRFWFNSELKPLCKEAENLSEMLIKYGVNIMDVTPDFSTEEIRRTKKFSLVKADEILAWLMEHKEVEKWIVIDDLDLHNQEIEKHQVKTDANIGITIEDINKAEKMLNV